MDVPIEALEKELEAMHASNTLGKIIRWMRDDNGDLVLLQDAPGSGGYAELYHFRRNSTDDNNEPLYFADQVAYAFASCGAQLSNAFRLEYALPGPRLGQHRAQEAAQEAANYIRSIEEEGRITSEEASSIFEDTIDNADTETLTTQEIQEAINRRVESDGEHGEGGGGGGKR